MPRFKELLERMGNSSMVEVAKGDKKAEPSTSSYQSIDLTEDDKLDVDFLRSKVVAELEANHRAFSCSFTIVAQ